MASYTAGGGTRTNAYNGDGTLVAQTLGGTTTRYVQDLAAPLSQVLNSGGANYVYGSERLYASTSGTKTWYQGDALSSVRQTLNNVGVVQSTINYDPWGQVQSGTVPTFGFTGEQQDGSLVNLRAWWYNASRGTFTSYRWRTDESFDEIPYSHHPYAYALGDPVLYTDPAGTYAVRDGDGRQGRDTSAATCFEKGGLWDAVVRTCYVFGQEIPLQRYTQSPQPADNTHECLGNPLAVELQIPLYGGGTAPVCLNAPMTELNPAYFHLPRKPKPLGIIEQFFSDCGILLATGTQDEDDEEDNIGLSSSGTPPIGNSRSELKNVYNKKTDSPNWPQGFTQADESIRVKVDSGSW